MRSTEELDLNFNINQANSKQLKMIIQKLIYKSKLLIQNLESAIKQLEHANIQKQYWKTTYFNFRQNCQRYIQSKGIAPFQQLSSLQSQLKMHNFDIQKNQFQSKLQQKISSKIQTSKKFETKKALSLTQRKQQFSNFSVQVDRNSPKSISKQKIYYSKRKHEIGPKKIQLFKAKQGKIIKI